MYSIQCCYYCYIIAIEKYLVAFLSKRKIDIALPRVVELPQLEEVDGGGGGRGERGSTPLVQSDGQPTSSPTETE